MQHILLIVLAVLCAVQSGHSCDNNGNCEKENDNSNEQPEQPDVVACSTGSLECCNKVSAKDKLSADQINIIRNVLTNGLSGLKGLWGLTDVVLNLKYIVGDIGFQCSPLAVPVVGAALSVTTCNTQTVCCTNTTYNGIIALGCIPIVLNTG